MASSPNQRPIDNDKTVINPEAMSSMRGVLDVSTVDQQKGEHTRVSKNSKYLQVYPSVSRGRGYAVVLLKEGDNGKTISIKPAPKTTALARTGRLTAIPAASSLNDLPDIVLLNLFSWLDESRDFLRCLSVCKRWNKLLNPFFDNADKPITPIARLRTPITKPLETAKIKIFGNAKTTGIDTNSQKKDNGCFREVIVKIGESENKHAKLLDYLRRLSKFVIPTHDVVFADIDMNDALLLFVIQKWQARLSEIRLLRCSLDGISITGVAAINEMRRLKHFYIDNCQTVPKYFLDQDFKLLQFCKNLTRVELCFTENNATVASLVDEKFLDSLAAEWKLKSDIRWMKICYAPNVTTAGIGSLIGRYFKLKWPRQCEVVDDEKMFCSYANFVLWLKNTSFDVDEFMTQIPLGRKWFQETPIKAANKRHIRDSYGGKDIMIWVEKDL